MDFTNKFGIHRKFVSTSDFSAHFRFYPFPLTAAINWRHYKYLQIFKPGKTYKQSWRSISTRFHDPYPNMTSRSVGRIGRYFSCKTRTVSKIVYNKRPCVIWIILPKNERHHIRCTSYVIRFNYKAFNSVDTSIM